MQARSTIDTVAPRSHVDTLYAPHEPLGVPYDANSTSVTTRPAGHVTARLSVGLAVDAHTRWPGAPVSPKV